MVEMVAVQNPGEPKISYKLNIVQYEEGRGQWPRLVRTSKIDIRGYAPLQQTWLGPKGGWSFKLVTRGGEW